MTISAFLVRVICLALPGIVSYMLFRKLAGKPKCEKWEEWCQIVLFSLITYAIYGICVWLFGLLGLGKGGLVFFKAILDDGTSIEWEEIVIASMFGIPIALIASVIRTYKLMNWFGRLMRVSRRFGDEDVWDYFHNLPDTPEYEWVVVRDHKTNLLYFGWIQAYSDSEKERELLMGDVSVCNNATGQPIYKVERLYLCRNKYDITIEIPSSSDEGVGKDDKLGNETKGD